MFAAHSHPYMVQAVALWFSFLPGFAVAGLIAGTQVERLRRTSKPAHRRHYALGNEGDRSCNPA